MDFSLTEEQKHIRDEVRRFAESELAPDAAERDAEERFPEKQIKKLGELGFMGIGVDAKYGGGGADTISYVLLIEELSRVDASVGVIVSVNNSLVCHGIETFGSDEQKQKYLVPLATGKALGAYCLSEPGTGSDASNLQTTARREGEYYVLNGTKNFITNGLHADYFILFATVEKADGYKGVCAFITEKTMEGFSIGRKEEKLGIRSSDTAVLNFDHVRVPAKNLLGEERKGFHVALNILDAGRIGIAAQALGIARASLEAAVHYAKERRQFGQPIINFQALQFMLADLDTEIDAARWLVFRAAAKRDAGEKYTVEAAKAKLYASRVAVDCGVKAVQVFGGVGYTKDYPVERYMRDAKITEIYEGTSEVQKLVIGRSLIE